MHSKFARATSRDLDLEHMALWASKKGVSVLATGDFTHPAWFSEISDKLVPVEAGLFRLRDDLESWVKEQLPPVCYQPTRFMLEVEISTIYKKGDKTRKIHHLIYVPDLDSAQRLRQKLSTIGNINSDGRPILGLDSRDLLEITLECGEGSYLIPAHIWTPWFAALGSKSGFDAIDECYGDLTSHIFAVETGLSSDPPMNWRLAQLDRYQLVSNSDAHSPGKIGREACVFDCEMDYWSIRKALESGVGYGGTVEFFPEEGKYHQDGHRNCGISLEPEETKRYDGLCPVCGKNLTIGVLHRVDSLADRPVGYEGQVTKPFRSLVPLPEVLSEIQQVGPNSKKVKSTYEELIRRMGSELYILEQAPIDELCQSGSMLLGEGIARMRESKVMRQAGYDGEYGVIRLFDDDEITQGSSVSLLFEMPSIPKLERRPSARKLDLAGTNDTPNQDSESESESGPSIARDGGRDYLPLRHELLAGLDAEQRAAAETLNGPLRIIAGPGTGKTRTLTHRIAHLIRDLGVGSESCLALTFTNRAAGEMKERLGRLLPEVAAPVAVMTFHQLGHQMIRDHGKSIDLELPFRVIGEGERLELLTRKLDVSERKAKRLMKRFEHFLRGQTYSEPEDDSPAGSEIVVALQTYRKALRDGGFVDFDDLIRFPLEILEKDREVRDGYRERFQWISVDEFQDIDPLQYRLIKLLSAKNGNLCVIGDPDQSIYGFRHADATLFDRFQHDFPQCRSVLLKQNYRSGRAIVRGALQTIGPSSLVHDRELKAQSESSIKITIHQSQSDKAEAEYVLESIERLIGGSSYFALDSGRVEGTERTQNYSFSDFAVLYRTEAQAELIGEALGRSGIPFQKHNHVPLVDEPFVQAVLLAGESERQTDSVSRRFHEIAQLMADSMDGLTSAMIEMLRPIAEECEADWPRFRSELELRSMVDLWDPRADRVSLLTLHASKGLEFPVVYIVGCEDGLLPLRWGSSDEEVDVAEERRLFFVGMTRAKERLILSHAQKRFLQGKARPRKPSPFVATIEEDLVKRSQSKLKPKQPKPEDRQLGLFSIDDQTS